MDRLFKKLRDYEKVQCHIYMKLLDTKESDLVKYKKRTKILQRVVLLQ